MSQELINAFKASIPEAISSKVNSEITINNIVQAFKDGTINKSDAVNMCCALTPYYKFTKELIDALREFAADGASAYGKLDNMLHGVKFTITSGGSVYDYSGIPEIVELTNEIEESKARLKIMQDRLKLLIKQAHSGAADEAGVILKKPVFVENEKDSIKFELK